jgi:hypothetical protein
LRFAAPLELLRAAHEAAVDEIAHAEACLRLAERFGGARVTPGPFPFPAELALSNDLAELAKAAVREGCLAETLGAHLAVVAAQHAPEADIRETLHRLGADEARHSVLSYRVVAWALRAGGAAVRDTVNDAFAEPWPQLDVTELALRSGVAAAVLQAAADAGIREILEPARAQLLAA